MTQKTLMHADFTFETAGWKEDLVTQLEGESKVTRVSTANVYAGDLEGKSEIDYLLYYLSAGTCSYTGFERVTGKLGAAPAALCSIMRGCMRMARPAAVGL